MRLTIVLAVVDWSSAVVQQLCVCIILFSFLKSLLEYAVICSLPELG